MRWGEGAQMKGGEILKRENVDQTEPKEWEIPSGEITKTKCKEENGEATKKEEDKNIRLEEGRHPQFQGGGSAKTKEIGEKKTHRYTALRGGKGG